MKRLFITLFVLMFSMSAFASEELYFGKKAVSSCPSYYASAILSWNGDHPSGVLYGCDSSGNAVLFTDSGSDISTYGEDSSNALKVDDVNEYIYHDQGAGVYVDETDEQTVCVKINISAQLDNDACRIWGVEDAGQNDQLFGALKGSTARHFGEYKVQVGTDESAYSSGTTSYTTWIVVGYSWDKTNQDHSANAGDQATWQNGWNEEANELDESMTDRPTRISIGSRAGNDPGDTEYVYIDDFAVIDGYQSDCKTVLGW